MIDKNMHFNKFFGIHNNHNNTKNTSTICILNCLQNIKIVFFLSQNTFFTFSLSSVHFPVTFINELSISISVLILFSGDFLTKLVMAEVISLNYFWNLWALCESRIIP